MRYLLFICFLNLFCLTEIYSQCRIQTNQRDDGATIRYMSPDRIGRADKFFMGASMQTNGIDFYVATISIFPNNAENLSGIMTIQFANSKSSKLEHISSQPTTFHGYPATLSIFYADTNDLKNIATSNMKMVMVRLQDGTLQLVKVSMNSNILEAQYKCLK